VRYHRRVLARSAVGLLSSVVFLVSLHVFRDHLASWDLGAIRLQRTFALAEGVPLYPPPGEGVAMLPLYGPVGAIVHLPAVLAGSPTCAIAIGQLLGLLYFFTPPLAWHLAVGRRTGHPALALLAFLLFVAGSIDLWPLEYAAFTVHVDAPALGFALLACLALFRATAATWRCAYGLVWFGPPQVLWFHLVTVPSRHPWRLGGGGHALLTGAGVLGRELATLWAICLMTLGLRIGGLRTQAGTDRRQALRREPSLLLWLVGLAMLPTALLGFVKVGGDRNAFSYVAYFFLAGATLSLLETATAAADRPALTRSRGLARFALLAIPTLLLAIVATAQEPGSLRPWRHPLNRDTLPHEIAFRYARRHPGEAYFPRLTLASYFAEGRLYHQSPGFIDAYYAGVPIDEETLWAHLPPRLRIVAFARNGYQDQVGFLPFREQLEVVPDDPELPGFDIYEWRGEGRGPSPSGRRGPPPAVP
jgi:hypothetical protein